jgi:hypothetical protein
MKKLLVGLASLLLLPGVGIAGQPITLNDSQLNQARIDTHIPHQTHRRPHSGKKHRSATTHAGHHSGVKSATPLQK